MRIRTIFYILCVFYQGIYQSDSDEHAYSPCLTPFVAPINYQCVYLFTDSNYLLNFRSILSRNLSPRLRRRRIISMPNPFISLINYQCVYLYTVSKNLLYFMRISSRNLSPRLRRTRIISMPNPFISLINYQCVFFIYGFE